MFNATIIRMPKRCTTAPDANPAQIGRIQHADHNQAVLATLCPPAHRTSPENRASADTGCRCGQIENTQGLSRRRGKTPFFALYRDTGVVRYFLTAASQSIKIAVLPQLGLPTKATKAPLGNK